jgi:hypothetical protein
MFSLTRSNLLRQFPDLNEIIRRLLEIVTVSNSIGTYFWQLLYTPASYYSIIPIGGNT